jgi:diguanylate cyclase (GGDEF)-like protein
VKILVADDHQMSREIVGRLVTRWGYAPVYACDGAEAAQILEGPDPPLLAIVDWLMPKRDGVDVCRMVRSRRPYPYTYFIILTGKTNKPDLLDCLEAGADDYLCKPVNADELRARLYVAGRILDLQQQLLSACNQAQYEATHDAVTALWNRTSILKFVDHYLGRCAVGDTLALVLVEVGGVKEVNNEFGRAAGDDVLRQAADILRSAVQAYDCIGRYVGGEFLIIMPNSTKRRLDLLLDQIDHQLSAAEISLPRGTTRLPIRVATVELSDHTPENSKGLLARLERNLATGCSPRPKATEAASPQPAPRPVADPGRPILVMGSDPLQRSTLARRVAALGHSVAEAGSSEDAWNILQGPKQVGALLLDMRTCEPDELNFVEELRADPTFSGLDVVVAAARPVQGTVSRALSLNVSSFLSKPVDIVKLSEILTYLVGAPRLGA